MRHNRDDDLRSRRHLVEFHNIHNTRIDERTHWIRKDVGGFVHSLRVIGNIHSHRLFSHRTLIRVSRRLIVLGKWNARREDTEYGARMNLAVGIFKHIIALALGQIARTH